MSAESISFCKKCLDLDVESGEGLRPDDDEAFETVPGRLAEDEARRAGEPQRASVSHTLANLVPVLVTGQAHHKLGDVELEVSSVIRATPNCRWCCWKTLALS